MTATQELKVITTKSTSDHISPTDTLNALKDWAAKHQIVLPLTALGRFPIFTIFARAKGAINA